MVNRHTSELEEKVGFFEKIGNFFSKIGEYVRSYTPLALGVGLVVGLAFPLYAVFGLSWAFALNYGAGALGAGVVTYRIHNRYNTPPQPLD